MRRIVIAIFAGLVVTAIAGGACHSSGLERELVSRIRLEWELPEYIAIPIAGFVVPAYIGLILAALVAYRRPALPVDPPPDSDKEPIRCIPVGICAGVAVTTMIGAIWIGSGLADSIWAWARKTLRLSDYVNFALMVLSVPAVFGLIVTTLITYRRPIPNPGVCRRCGYNLTGNQSGRCPECGQAPPNQFTSQDSGKEEE
jgi:predicted histidine transporter YuiF (NhaC family)